MLKKLTALTLLPGQAKTSEMGQPNDSNKLVMLTAEELPEDELTKHNGE